MSNDADEYVVWQFRAGGLGVNGSHRSASPAPAPTRVVERSGEGRVGATHSHHGSHSEQTMTTTLIHTLPDADQLLAKRAEIVRRLAPLRAYYGGTGYAAERRFKMEEAKVANLVRAQMEAAGEKVTEPKVDAATRCHPSYVEAFTQDVLERQKWIALEEELNEVEHRLRVRASDSYLLGAEARLT